MARSKHEIEEIKRVDRILKNLGLPTWTETHTALRDYISDTNLASHDCTMGYCYACDLISIAKKGAD